MMKCEICGNIIDHQESCPNCGWEKYHWVGGDKTQINEFLNQKVQAIQTRLEFEKGLKDETENYMNSAEDLKILNTQKREEVEELNRQKKIEKEKLAEMEKFQKEANVKIRQKKAFEEEMRKLEDQNTTALPIYPNMVTLSCRFVDAKTLEIKATEQVELPRLVIGFRKFEPINLISEAELVLPIKPILKGELSFSNGAWVTRKEVMIPVRSECYYLVARYKVPGPNDKALFHFDQVSIRFDFNQ